MDKLQEFLRRYAAQTAADDSSFDDLINLFEPFYSEVTASQGSGLPQILFTFLYENLNRLEKDSTALFVVRKLLRIPNLDDVIQRSVGVKRVEALFETAL